MMNPFERNISESLRRQSPPAGFAERVLRRAEESVLENRSRSAWLGNWRWVTAAAMATVLLGGFWFYREYRRNVEEERAKAQLLFALRITGAQFHNLEEKLARVRELKFEVVEPSQR